MIISWYRSDSNIDQEGHSLPKRRFDHQTFLQLDRLLYLRGTVLKVEREVSAVVGLVPSGRNSTG
jgi:hypothetical protein